MIMSSSTCMKKATHVGGIRKRGNKAPRGYFRYGGKGTIVHAIVPFFMRAMQPEREKQRADLSWLWSARCFGSLSVRAFSQALAVTFPLAEAGVDPRVACQHTSDPVTTSATPFQKESVRSAPIQKVAKTQERTGVK